MATMAERPPLVVAVERALDGPARWVRYALGPADRFAPSWQPESAQPVVSAPLAPPPPPSEGDLSETPPLVAAVEEALGSLVETLRYLPSIAPAAAAPGQQPAPLRPPAVPPETSTTDDALVVVIEAAVSEAVLWVKYAPSTDAAHRNSRRVA
jgi:hypothetical protein